MARGFQAFLERVPRNMQGILFWPWCPLGSVGHLVQGAGLDCRGSCGRQGAPALGGALPRPRPAAGLGAQTH